MTAQRPPRPDRLLEDAERAQRSGDFAAAAVALRGHLDAHPGDDRNRLRFATVLIALGDGARARTMLAPLCTVASPRADTSIVRMVMALSKNSWPCSSRPLTSSALE